MDASEFACVLLTTTELQAVHSHALCGRDRPTATCQSDAPGSVEHSDGVLQVDTFTKPITPLDVADPLRETHCAFKSATCLCTGTDKHLDDQILIAIADLVLWHVKLNAQGLVVRRAILSTDPTPLLRAAFNMRFRWMKSTKWTTGLKKSTIRVKTAISYYFVVDIPSTHRPLPYSWRDSILFLSLPVPPASSSLAQSLAQSSSFAQAPRHLC